MRGACGVPPAYYDYVNTYNDIYSPSTVHIKNTGLAWFFKKYLLQEAISVFEWKIPEHWSKYYFLYALYGYGCVSVINTDKYGIIPQICSLEGYDIFFRPAYALIKNPLLNGTKRLRIGEQCTLFFLQPGYCGITDIVSFYGDMMALTAQAAGVNLLNSKLSYVFTAKDKASAESFKKMYDQLASGEPSVVQDAKLLTADGKPSWQAFEQNVGNNYIADRLLDDLRRWKNEFSTAIGIPNGNTMKKERLIVDEVNANNFETISNCSLWLENLQKIAKETNELFGEEVVSVDWKRELRENVGMD